MIDFNATLNQLDFTSSPARYAKGKTAIRCASGGTIYSTPSMRLAEALGGRWTNREKAYILSPKAARDMHILTFAGWRGSAAVYRGEPSWFSHPIHGTMDRRNAVKIAERDCL
jgi:hypothetical protein